MFKNYKVIWQYFPNGSTDSIQSLSKYNGHFCRNGKADPNYKGPLISIQDSLEKELRRTHTSQSFSNQINYKVTVVQNSLQSYSNQNSVVLAKG